jgi:hypothetical protein
MLFFFFLIQNKIKKNILSCCGCPDMSRVLIGAETFKPVLAHYETAQGQNPWHQQTDPHHLASDSKDCSRLISDAAGVKGCVK